MTKRALWLGLMGYLVFAATPSLAAEEAHGKGSWEVTFTTDFDQGFSPSIGYYIVDNLALTVQATYSQGEAEQSGVTQDVTHTAFGAGVEYNIPTGGAVVPFVGIALEYFTEEEDTAGVVDELSGTAIEVAGGVKLMVGERGSVNFILSYLTGTVEPTSGGVTDPDIDVTDVSVGLGYSLYFH